MCALGLICLAVLCMWGPQVFCKCIPKKDFTNIERDWHRRIHTLFDVDLQPFWIPVTLQGPDGDPMITNIPTLAPYEVFAEMHKSGQQFLKSMLGKSGVAGVDQYWELFGRGVPHHVNQDPEKREFRSCTIPMFFHSDGGEVYKTAEYSIWSWSSALADDLNTFDTKQFICCIDESKKVKLITDAELIAFLIWNVHVLESGVFPSTNHMGEALTGSRALRAGLPLAEGWRASCVGTQADLKEKVKCNRFTRNYQANFLCERCLGCRHRQDGNAYDFRSTVIRIPKVAQMMPVHKFDSNTFSRDNFQAGTDTCC
jgi:hypothetical protein